MLSGNITHKRSGSPHGCSSEQLSLSLAPLPADTSSGTYSASIQLQANKVGYREGPAPPPYS